MTLTLDLYLCFLEKEFALLRPVEMDGTVPIKRVCPWRPGRNSPDELYLLPGGTSGCTAPLAMHVAAKDTPPQVPGKNELWLLAPESSYENVLCRAMEIYIEFVRFTSEVTVLALTKKDMKAALAMMRDALGIGVSIVDKDYLVLESLTHENNAPLYEAGRDSLQSGQRMDHLQVENLYLTDARFDETFTLQGLREFCRYNLPEYKGLCLYYNFFIHGQYAGRMIYVLRSDIYSDSLLPFLEEYSSLIYECFRSRDEHSLARSATAVHRFLLDLVEWDMKNIAPALTAFRRIGWEAEDSFRAICLSGKGYARSEMTMAYLCTMLEDTFPACVATCRGQTIYCLHNRTRDDKTGFLGDLAMFLRDNLLQAGLSCVFAGLENSGSHFREAEAALLLGERSNDSFWLHYFHNHTLSYVLAKAEEEIPLEDLYSPVLKTLLDYDSEHPEISLTETLYTYICCHFNASRAADALFIHRTTFLYRMNKLKSLVKLDLEDFDALTELMLSFVVLRRQKS
ncbi:MAG: helix-turn-helix domain-containing protein [Eubacteriales bacterium]|nr:helix-turn-helix domain-containing protein [Eubacteriales bacterium]